MSHYDDDERPRRRKSHRDKPVYEEEVYESRGSRGGGSRQKALVRRTHDDDSDSSVEEIQRDFAPRGAGYRKSGHGRRARSADYDDDYREPPRRRHGGGRRRDYSSSSSSESPPRSRRKSLGEQAMAALGLGGAAAAAGRSKSRDRGRGRGHGRRGSYSSYSSRSSSRDVDQKQKIQQAVKAALTAGAVEAFRSRKEPGGWTGDKGKRVLTAAIGAGGVNSALTSGKDPDKKDGRHGIEAVIGGLVTNRLVNGERSRSRGPRGGRHSREEKSGGSGLGGLAAGGLAAAAGKALLNARNRSKSRGRKDYSSDSDDNRGPRRDKKRSSSVGAYLDKGMAALGLKDKEKPRRSRHYDDDDYDDYRSSRGPPPTQGRLRGGGGEGGDGVRAGGTSSSDDDMSSSEEERQRKKMGRKELITAGLASVATIHAAHSVYSSIEARDKRHKQVVEGKMTPEEAKKLRNKARLQDAASVGIAALGIKGAISEWKEMQEQRHECLEFDEKRKERHERRLRKMEEKRMLGSSAQYASSEPHLPHQSYDQPYEPTYAPNYAPPGGTRYQDDNPYHSGGPMPPPPMGPQSAHY